MTEEEFIDKWEYLIPEFYHVELAEDLESVIQQAIAEHEASHNKSRKEIIDYFKSQYGDPEQYTDAKAVIEGINYCFDFGIAKHEQSKWKKYPENKPDKSGWYWVHHKDGYESRVHSEENWELFVESKKVIAFRELPAPFKGKEERK